MTKRHVAEAVKLADDAGKKVQRILLDLDEALGGYHVHVSHVAIDTRNFANMGVEIHVE